MSKILVTVNGQSLSIADDSSLQDLLLHQEVHLDSVALVSRGQVVPKSLWASTICKEGDVIELFGVVAGG
jgi:thiamine biosynthesis protein ThiS